MLLSYLLMGNKLVSIYWMMHILQPRILLIPFKIHQPVMNFRHTLIRAYVLLISMGKIPSQLKDHLMNSIAIRHHSVNPGSISFYIEGKYTRGWILKIFVPYLINLDLWFHILKFISQKIFQPQRILVNLIKLLKDSSRKNIYFCSMTRKIVLTLFCLPYQ